MFSNQGAIYDTQAGVARANNVSLKTHFQNVTKPLTELLWVATGCCKIYFSFVGCHKPKKVGNHWSSPYLDWLFHKIGYMGVVVKQHR